MQQRRRRRKRKSVIRVYIARAIFALVLLTMLVLMFCGCLYIRDLFKKDDVTQPNVSADADDKDESSKKDKEGESEDTSKYTQYPDVHIVIDPGHGGNDGGTSNDEGTVIEKDINIAISEEVVSLLKKHGVEVTLTRDSDVYLSLEERVHAANQTTADLFVSLHCNYFEGDSSIDGLEAFYCRNAEGSRVYAESVVNAATENGNIIIRGATENNYYVTKNVAMNAILIEMGFLSNPAECEKLNSAEYQKILAETIVKGILAPFGADDTADTTTTD